jgi:hypothetical protein
MCLPSSPRWLAGYSSLLGEGKGSKADELCPKVRLSYDICGFYRAPLADKLGEVNEAGWAIQKVRLSHEMFIKLMKCQIDKTSCG